MINRVLTTRLKAVSLDDKSQFGLTIMVIEKHSVLIVGTVPVEVTAALNAMASLDVDFRHVSAAEYEAALSEQRWDAILCAFEIPQPASALQTARALHPETPFYFISDTASVPDVVELMRQGARGFAGSVDHQRLAEMLRHDLAARGSTIPDENARYRSIVDHQTELICRYDTEFRLTFVNRAYAEWMGSTREALIGQTFLNRIPEAVREQAVAHVRNLTVEQPVAVSVHPALLPDGSQRVVEWTDRALFDADGQIVEYQGIGRDITARKQVEEALRETMDWMRLAMDAADLGKWQHNLAAGTVRFDERACAHFGLTPETATLEQIVSHIHPEDRARYEQDRAAWLNAPSDRNSAEYRFIHPDGSVHWVAVQSQYYVEGEGDDHRLAFGFGTTQDITERKATEATLRASEARIRGLIQGAPVAIVLSDKQGTITDANQQAYRIFGYDDDELIGQSIDVLVPENLRSCHAVLRQQFLDHPESIAPGRREFNAARKDGSLFPVAVELAYLPDGGDMSFMSFITDITEARQVQATLQYQANLLQQVSDAIIATDADLRITAWNAAATRIYGWTEAEALGQPIDQLLRTEWPYEKQAQAQAAVADIGYWRGEIRQWTKDGKQRAILASVSLLSSDGKPTGGVTVNHDVTNRKRQETFQMRISQILEAVAEAHPLKSLLEMLTLAVEEYQPDLKASVLLLDRASGRVHHGAAPSLPEAYNKAIDGLPIGPRAGSCGTAAFRKRLVIVEDIQTDPLWADYRHLAEPHGLRACWSQPILDTNDEVLGTFALYYRQPQRPSEAEIDLIRMAAHLAGIAIRRKQSEDALRASEALFRRFMQHLAGTVLIYDHENRLVYCNDRYAESMNVRASDIIGKPVDAFAPPDLAAMVRDENHFVRTQHQVFENDYSIDNHGTLNHWRIIKFPIPQENAPTLVGAIAIDTTKEKLAEAALRQSEEQFQQFMRHLPGGVFIKDSQHRITYCNEQYARVYGRAPEELIGKHNRDYMPLDIANAFDRENQRVLEQDRAVEFSHILPGADGDEHWLSIKFPIPRENQPPLLGSVSLNVTREKRAEAALRASEARQRAILEAIPDLMFRTTFDGTFLDFHAQSQDQLLLPPEAFIGRQIKDVLSPEVARQHQESVNQVIATGQPARHEYQLNVNGEVRDFEARLVLVGDNEVLAIVRDVTERKRAEAALQAAHDLLDQRVRERTAELERVKNRIEAIFNHSGDGIVLINLEQGIRQANFAFERLLRVTLDDYLGVALTTFVHPDDAAGIDATIQAVATLHETRQLEVQAKRADGSLVDVEISIAPVNRSERMVTNLVCIIRDISERKQAQRVIAEERNLLRALIDTVPDFIYTKDRQHRIMLCNAAQARALGLTPDEVVGKTDFDLFPPEMAAKFYADEEVVFETQRPVANIIERSIGHDGHEIWALTTKVPLYNLNGEVVGLLGTTHDITQLKASEEALQRSQADLRSVIDSTNTAFVLMDRDGVIRVANVLAREMSLLQYGHRLEVGQSIFDYLPPRLHDDFRANFARVLGGERLIMEETLSTPSGQLYLEFRYFPVMTPEGEIIGVNAATENITEYKNAEAALARKYQDEMVMQSYLRALHEVSIELARTETLDEFYRLTVELGKEHFGFERMGFLLYDAENGEVIGTYGSDANGRTVAEHDLRLTPAGQTGILQRTMERAKRFAFDEKARLYDNDNLLGDGNSAAAALWDGELLGWLKVDNAVAHQPITKAQLDILSLYAMTVGSLFARKRAEETALSLSRRLDLATRSGGIGIWEWDIESDSLVWDDRMYALYGLVRHEDSLTSEIMLRSIHPDDLQREIEASHALLNEGRLYDTEFRIIRPDGEIRYIKATGIATYDLNGRATRMVGVNLDLTDLKRSEEALRQALGKEKELGELKSRFVSMASHEFRTPLAAILAATETLKIYRDKMDDNQINARLTKIGQHVNHMKSIMEDVLHLARIQAGRVEFRPGLGDLDALCREIIEEYDSQPFYQGRISYECLDAPLAAFFDERLIRQAISNLLSNALKYSITDSPVYLHLFANESAIIIKVADKGIGIPAEDQKHLFEPFHRAHNVGTIPGTGLGLSITKQAVEIHGGTITVESEAEKGTTFIVTLPTGLSGESEDD